MCFLRGTCYPKQNDFDPPHSWRRQVGVVLRVDLLSNRAVRSSAKVEAARTVEYRKREP